MYGMEWMDTNCCGLIFVAWSCLCYLLGRWHENRWVGESVGRWVQFWHARVNGQKQAGN